MVELSNEAQELLIKFQTQNQQLQELTAQKQSLELRKLEIEEALKEIENKEEVYKEVAGLLLKVDKNKVKKELEEEKDLIEIKNKQLTTLEGKLKEELEKSKGKLEEIFKQKE
ncbi:MAG TPA: hypothetical protein EYP80_00350 [Candidatus Aenigmarchaeota archaeon]|nr:hypothetical protein [Candidatus Aenigmarchaeota archaeon]